MPLMLFNKICKTYKKNMATVMFAKLKQLYYFGWKAKLVTLHRLLIYCKQKRSKEIRNFYY